MLKNEDLFSEIERIRSQDPEGKVRPNAVVDEARDPSSPLHDRFEWDDTLGGEQYRLIQARRLIRAAVTLLPSTNKPCRAYVSLTSDRSSPEEDEELGSTGSYRLTADVLGSDQLQRLLLQDALDELKSLEVKYRQLQELAGVFAAYKAAAAKVKTKATRKKKAAPKKTRRRATASK